MNNNKEILFFKPYYVDLIWGGDNLKTKYRFDTPTKTIGEAWCISAYPEQSSMVINGKYKGKELNWLWKNHSELFGNLDMENFPLLIKFIDANNDLSVQVHPDDSYAQKVENEPFGKKECWYILDCIPNTDIILGQNTKSKEEFESAINNKQWDKVLNRIPIKPGDFFQIDPGTVHAIQAGTIILETQQTSDLTYRLYDYDRLQNGKPRELHIDKAIDVIDFQHYVKETNNYSDTNKGITELIKCDKYCVELINITDSFEADQTYPFLNCTVISGEGKIDANKISAGDSFIIPAEYGNYKFEGNLKVITSHI